MIDINMINLHPFAMFEAPTKKGEDWLVENCGFSRFDDFVAEHGDKMSVLSGAFEAGLSVAVDGRPIEHMETLK